MESKGLLKSNNKITYEYEIQVTNNRKTEESIRVYDQLPIAMNEKIKIELLNPTIKEDEMDNERKIEWHLKLKPGEKKILPFKYMVEFPKNQTVFGWE